MRIVLAIAAYFDYEIWQMDVKTSFLHGNLTEDVYMIQPEGFVDPTSTSKVCKLKRSIYGLRQALEVQTFVLMRSSLVSVSSKVMRTLVYTSS